jgi:hypothetical protein
MGFRQELLAQGQEIHPRNMIPPGITSSWKLIQTGKIKMCKKRGNNFRISKYKSYILRRLTFYKFKYENFIKIKNKPDPDLSGGSYLFNEIKKGHQNLVSLSL